MGFRGRIFSIAVVAIFNVLRYFYYHQYMGLPFRSNFFILTAVFMMIAWWCGKQYDRAQYYSEKDPLTNTFNRRKVEQLFQKFVSVYKKQGGKFGLVMIDLNNFKQINDQYGHNKGDEVIQKVGFVLQHQQNRGDAVARWGGDEFLLLVRNIETGFNLAPLQEQLAKIDLASASIGTAVFPDHGKTLEQLIQHADEEMYKMKRMTEHLGFGRKNKE